MIKARLHKFNIYEKGRNESFVSPFFLMLDGMPNSGFDFIFYEEKTYFVQYIVSVPIPGESFIEVYLSEW